MPKILILLEMLSTTWIKFTDIWFLRFDFGLQYKHFIILIIEIDLHEFDLFRRKLVQPFLMRTNLIFSNSIFLKFDFSPFPHIFFLRSTDYFKPEVFNLHWLVIRPRQNEIHVGDLYIKLGHTEILTVTSVIRTINRG